MRAPIPTYPLLVFLVAAALVIALFAPAATAEPAAAADPVTAGELGATARQLGAAAVLPPAGTPRTGVDYVKMNVDWPVFFAKLKATGRDFIGRYLPVYGAMHRCVTTTELAGAAAAGVDCFFWFETMTDLYRASRGYAAGAADATEALAALARLGVPTTTPVYFTVDWDNPDGDVIDPYFKGIASVLPVSQIGVYGNYATIDWLWQRAMATHFCQSNAWFDERGWHPAAQMHQDITTHSIGGVWVDRLTVTSDYFGQLRRREQVDPRLLYAGAWQTSAYPAGAYSGGNYGYSSAAGASVTVAFNGTGLDWLGKKGPVVGTAAVSVDGGPQTAVDLYASSTAYKQKVWSTGALPDGLHIVTITRNSGTINVDAFDITGALVSLTWEEDTSAAFTYGGDWTSVADPAASGSSYRRSVSADASATICFTGQRLQLLATTGPGLGTVDVSVDGGLVSNVDLSSASIAHRQEVWDTGSLAAGHHVMTLTRNTSSPAGSPIGLDAVRIVGVAAQPPSITSVVPDYGSTGVNKTTVISGTDFVGLTGTGAVTFGGIHADSYTVESAYKITAVSPPQASGMVQVQVNAAGGATVDTAGDDYTYLPAVTYRSLRGANRYETAILISRAVFPDPLPAGRGLVLAPGETFPEALCAAPLAAALGGPVLLSYTGGLPNDVRAEILRLAPAEVICVGLPPLVVDQVSAALGQDVAVTSITGAGGSVYDMSYQVAQSLAAEVGDMSSATAIITIGTNFPDAIAVSGLACAQLWPVLLTDKSDGSLLHPRAVAALADLGITTTLKVGTYTTLPAGVTGLANLSGNDRYYTNANVAVWAAAHASLAFDHVALATGEKFPDALAAGPYLAADGGSLLLTPLYGPVPAPIVGTLSANLETLQRFTFIACIEPVTTQIRTLLP